MRRLWIAFVVAAAAVAMWPAGNAGATAPFKTGYWVQAQAAALPLGLPAPPDPVVPKGGLYVANGPDGPKAVSAVAYEVEGVAPATLTLKVHSVAPAAPPPEVPSPTPSVVHLSACMVDGDWAPAADGGSGKWEERPSFDPSNCGFGTVSTDGATVTFELIAERQQSEGVFNLVIVPDPSLTGEANTPFSVTFQAPLEDSLLPGEPEPTDEEETPEPIFDPAPTESEFDPGTFAEFTGGGEVPVLNAAPLPLPTTAVTAPRRVVLPPRTQPAVAVPGDGRGERIMAVSLLMALAVGWWWFGGQQTRGPQLLGSLASEGRRPARSADPTGGIGRFARPRLTKPRPLI